MKKIANKNRIFFFILGAMLTVQFARANDEAFSNNLLKMDVYKTSQGGVSIKLYTKKPYDENLVVNKKGENQYVILMPETANSMTAKPSTKGASDVVENVEVKTQPYSQASGQKGYTKIVISTSKPVEISSQIQALSQSTGHFSESDYEELMSQNVKKAPSTVKKAAPSLTVAQRAQLAAKKKLETAVDAKKASTALKTASKQVKAANKISKETKVASNLFKPVSKPKTLKEVVKEPEVQKNVQENIVPEKQVQTVDETTESPVEQTAVAPVEQEKVVNESAHKVPESLPENQITVYKNIFKNNLPLAGGILLIPLLVLFLLLRGARSTIQRMNAQKKAFTSNLDEVVSSPVDYTENITEDMDWQKKFKTYVETSEVQDKPQDYSQEEGISESFDKGDLDNLFSESPISSDEVADDIFEEDVMEQPMEQIDSESSFVPEIESGFMQSEEVSSSFSDILDQEPIDFSHEHSVDELFSDEDESEEAPVEDYESFDFNPEIENVDEGGFESEEIITVDEPDEASKIGLSNASSFVISDNSGFYLVNFEGITALVGYIGDEIYVLKKFETELDAKIQARLNEQKSDAKTYMVKVDGYRALVEVARDNMDLLIEL